MNTNLETLPAGEAAPLAAPSSPPTESLATALASDAAVQMQFNGTITAASDGVRDVLGLPPDALVETSVFRLIYERDWMPLFRGLAELVEEREEEVDVGFRVKTAAGSWRLVGATLRILREGPALGGVLLVLHPLLSVLT